MKTAILLGLCFYLQFLFFSCSAPATPDRTDPNRGNAKSPAPVELPEPSRTGTKSLEEVLAERVSQRQFSEEPVSLSELSQVLWAAQGADLDGVTGATRTAPSAGATHPLELFVISGAGETVTALPAGLYHYDHSRHELIPLLKGDLREDLSRAALQQGFIAEAPLSIVLAAEYERTTRRYGERGKRYVYMEIGHATQNIHLQAETLGLGSVAVGAFQDEMLKDVLETELEPLMIVPIGRN